MVKKRMVEEKKRLGAEKKSFTIERKVIEAVEGIRRLFWIVKEKISQDWFVRVIKITALCSKY